VADEIDSVLTHLLEPADTDPGTRRFARELIDGCRERLEQLDAHIAAVAENWEIGRMAVIDRNILRLASYELLFRDDVPPKVAINEAIDLAKRYSTADSGAFVNGILDRIRVERDDAAGPTDS